MGEGDALKIEISFINFPFKRVTSTSSSKLFLCVLFLKNIAQSNPYAKEAYFGVAYSATLQ